MTKKVIVGGILGGLVMFLWSAFSWMVLPWHQLTMAKFTDELAVAEVIAANAPYSGIYLLPNVQRLDAQGRKPPREEPRADALARMQAGPFLFASVARDGTDPTNPWLFLRSLIIQVVAATLITVLLVQTRGLRFWCRVGFVETTGVLIAVLATLPLWNWWQFPLRYTLVNFADFIIGVTLAGFVIAKVVGDIPAGDDESSINISDISQ
jgi:hypothetical protein